jgi:integrase/recombinase XerD
MRTGLRDYAIFLLIATYGLRTSAIAALKLDDINWPVGLIRIFPRKQGNHLRLPLTDEMGTALAAYLRHARADLPSRSLPSLRGSGRRNQAYGRHKCISALVSP